MYVYDTEMFKVSISWDTNSCERYHLAQSYNWLYSVSQKNPTHPQQPAVFWILSETVENFKSIFLHTY